MRRLLRSRYERKLGGICGGLALHTSTDPSLWRILFLALIFSPFPAILLYLLAWIVIPKSHTI